LFGLLDVAGRRQDNQRILSAAQATFRTMGCKLFAGDDINEADSMIELCIELNRTVMRAEAGVRSCPAFVGCYNEALATVCYTNAGHTPGLVRDDSGISLLAATGLPLGLFSHATPDAQMVALAPGAALLLVSRGIVEGQCRGEEFGLARVKENLQRGDHLSAKELGTRVLASVQEFMCRPPTDNDVTALALTRASATVGIARSDSSAEKAEIG
jgi:serine phosphatase RsbU (regulator of sigma subunit)